MPELKQDGDFVIASRSDRHSFEEFRDLPFNSKRPMPSCPLLLKYIEIKGISVTFIREFDCDFICGFPDAEIDELCEWAQEEINGQSKTDSK